MKISKGQELKKNEEDLERLNLGALEIRNT